VESPQPREFGKRRLATPPLHAEPVKRSRHVALLVMGSLAVGGSAYALMPRENCVPQSGVECPRGNGGGVGGSWSRSYFFGGYPSSNRSSTAASSDSGPGEVTRGGFGGFARAIAAHFSGS
jgi:hypothetical protein